ncbi:hypothetical protein AU106_gp101 [Sinorhizobium phage phiM9]|uniref:Uncharacterized protein n=1 Tax=Sinorhizobium phage phiM9 TaxID=1636182 RepID=A0A0F6R500_9CAUD|nr:hypothetical protein AU106_gp101 [Sinorhizobium phage phiM9]AKE44732.1 hypothetical protein Sm_phiM9_104 [Sinorhizobium phage phiM9]
MALPGEVVTTLVPVKFFVAGSFFEMNAEIVFSFWENNSYTIFETKLKCHGFPDTVIPHCLKSKMLQDHNFKKHMKDLIESIHHYEIKDI